jgi:hypothetical protein
MKLRYSTHSRFLPVIERALPRITQELAHEVRVDLGPRGYERDVHITIRTHDADEFDAEWESDHPSRFSARLRAAATVLQRRGFSGRFWLSHRDGLLVIRAA